MTEDKKAREAIRLLAMRINYLGDLKKKREQGVASTPLFGVARDPFLVDSGDAEVDLMVNAT